MLGRFAILLGLVAIFGCAHAGDGRPAYCKLRFGEAGADWDLDGDGVEGGGTDFSIYVHRCAG